jgi:hypothetical protein
MKCHAFNASAAKRGKPILILSRPGLALTRRVKPNGGS